MKILRQGWNIHNGKKQKFAKQSQQRKKNLLTAIFKCTMGIYTYIDDVVPRDTHGICEWALLPLPVTLWCRRNMRRWAVIIVC